MTQVRMCFAAPFITPMVKAYALFCTPWDLVREKRVSSSPNRIYAPRRSSAYASYRVSSIQTAVNSRQLAYEFGRTPRLRGGVSELLNSLGIKHSDCQEGCLLRKGRGAQILPDGISHYLQPL